MSVDRWNCTSYCLCKSRKGHFEKASDDGVWVLYADHQAEVERLCLRIEAMALLLYPDPNNAADWDCCDEHETTFPKGGTCPQCSVEPQPCEHKT